jgi:hypothetical protein
MDILLQMGAYSAAEELYSHGKHTYLGNSSTNGGMATSLSFLATSSGRSVVPQFDSFVRYYDGNEKYADEIVRDALTNESYSSETRRLLAVRTSQYMIMFMVALQGMHESIGECEANEAVRDKTSAEFWDKAAASIIGHLEGTENGGSREGMLFFALAKNHCEEFDTCSSPDPAVTLSADVNDKIISLLYAGRGAVLSRSCAELRKVTAELEPLLLVPMIQATLSSSEKLANSGIRQKALSAHHVEAHIYANMVLPLVEDVDQSAAKTIQTNLDLTGSPFRDGVGAVVEAFFLVYSGLGLNCAQIGESEYVDACNGTFKKKESAASVVGIAVGVTIGALAACLAAWQLWKRRKASQTKQSPVFVPSKGEMNHTDDLLRKSGDTNTGSPKSADDGDYPEDAYLEETAKINSVKEGDGVV